MPAEYYTPATEKKLSGDFFTSVTISLDYITAGMIEQQAECTEKHLYLSRKNPFPNTVNGVDPFL
jgi:hypothetical protein